jgi:NTE family protein
MSGRSGVGLALSGGGYRASLFHLGAIRRLHELGMLQKVTRLSSVSGGSILAGHLAQCLKTHSTDGSLTFSDWDEQVARPFHRFVKHDARTKPTLKYFLWGQLNPTLRANALRDHMYRYLTRLKLAELQDLKVEFIYLATDMKYGTAWQFRPDAMFTWRDSTRKKDAVGETTVATAVAASACFPPLFGPMKLTMPDGRKTYLTDGGVYDNSGMEPIWLTNKVVMVSDAGKPFDYEVPKRYFNKVLRYTAIASEQVRAQRHRFLIREFVRAKKEQREFAGTLWRLGSRRSRFMDKASTDFQAYVAAKSDDWYGYGDDGDVIEKIENIRTDLDVFLNGESGVLENHGYYMADVAAQRHLTKHIDDTPFKPPHPELLSTDAANDALKHSHSRLRFWRRWVSK